MSSPDILVPLAEIRITRTRPEQCLPWPQPHRGIQDKQCLFDLVVVVESVCTDQRDDLIMRANEIILSRSSGTQPVSLLRVFRREQRWDWHGDKFPHEPTQWRDLDGDGFGDNSDGHEGDACPNERGQSFFDRLGCRDSDGDGWSDPSQNWLASPWGQADAFPTDRLQWEDSDEDGFGDVPMGAKRDDCPDVPGTSHT